MPNANIYTGGGGAGPAITGHAHTGYGGGSGGGSGTIGPQTGAVGTISAQLYTASAILGYDTTPAKTQSDSPDLPALTMETADENGKRVYMTLTPESNISASDCMKLSMLMFAMTVEPESFNALNFVKKNNLERHFKYA